MYSGWDWLLNVVIDVNAFNQGQDKCRYLLYRYENVV